MNLPVDPCFYLDEGLPEYLAPGLSRFKFRCAQWPKGTPDEVSIKEIGKADGRLGVWISRDLGAKDQHRNHILTSGISVAWIIDQNGAPAKQCFLVYNFMYQYRQVIAASDAPLYFEVRELITDGIPNAVVSKVAL